MDSPTSEGEAVLPLTMTDAVKYLLVFGSTLQSMLDASSTCSVIMLTVVLISSSTEDAFALKGAKLDK